MALPRITWQDVQQMPDDGKRREAIRGGKPVRRRFTERIPVRRRGEVVDEIDLAEVFRRA